MKEIKNDTKATVSNQSVKQQESSKSEKENLTKSEKLSQKPSSVIPGQKESQDSQTERPSREHQHGFKTPEGKQSSSDGKESSSKDISGKSKKESPILSADKSKSSKLGFNSKRNF